MIDKYESKSRYVEKKMNENALVDTLTEAQHETLRWLCSFRHDLHCNQEALFYSEWSKYTEFWGIIDVKLGERLSEAGLPGIDLDIDAENFPTDIDCEELFDMTSEEALAEVVKMASDINRAIEMYLGNIDKEYGTHYCPTGIARLHM